MRLAAFITVTRPKERGDLIDQCWKSADQFADEITIINGQDTWPHEFKWPLIGEHFQKGYEEADGDWVIHLDSDFIFHEDHADDLRWALAGETAPAVSFYKWQFVLPDRYNLKSRLVLAVNKGKYGDRIRFDSGGDLCQPSLDGVEIKPDSVPEARIPFFNYEKLIKKEWQVKDDVGRMARAWNRHFGDWHLGGPDDESAYSVWLEMMHGRFYNKNQEYLRLEAHPKVMQDTISGLTEEQWGYSGFGNLEVNNYAKSVILDAKRGLD